MTTQWREGEVNSRLQTAYTGHRRIALNPAFFQHLDRKIDQTNAHRPRAAPILLWALPYLCGNLLGEQWCPAKICQRQSGDDGYQHFASVLRTPDFRTILAYLPQKLSATLRKPQNLAHILRWFNPSEKARMSGTITDGLTKKFVQITPSEMVTT